MFDRVRNMFRDCIRPISNDATRRRPGDAVRIVVAAIVLALLALHAHDPTGVERDLARLLRSLPDDVTSRVLRFSDLLALWTLGLFAYALVLVRRWRLARDVGIAGTIAWIVGHGVAVFVEHADLGHAFSVTLSLTNVPRFPLLRVAIGVAVMTVASSYLERLPRRLGHTIVVLLALTSISDRGALPADVLGAIVLGWGVGAVVHLAFKTSARRPTVDQVEAALAALDISACNIRAAGDQPVGRAVFLADGAVSTLRIIAIGRDEADAQLLARAWRWIAYRDAPPKPFARRRQQVAYEAYTMLRASDHGVSVPHVVTAATSGTLALLVAQNLEGEPFGAGEIGEAWTQMQRLHDAHISHGRLDIEHLVAHDGTVSIVGWEWSSTASGARQLDADVAQLLATTATIVGSELAVAAAVHGIGTERIAAALPLLQPNALSGVTRGALEQAPGIDPLAELRDRAADAVGTEPPELQELYRVNPQRLLLAVGALVAIAVLLSRVGNPMVFWDSIRNAQWGYVLVASALGILTDVAFAIAFLGTVPVRIPLWRSIELQSAMSFSNLAVPVAADAAIQIRFLQKVGLDLSSAVATGGIFSTVSELFLQGALFVVAFWLSPDSIDFGRIDSSQIVVIVLIVIFLIGAVAAVTFGVHGVRRVVVPRIVLAAWTVSDTVRSPSRVALLIIGNVAANCLNAASLLACLYAFDASVNFWTVLALNIGISLIASLVPLPGGPTAVSAVGMSATLAALGVSTPAAAAAVIAHQLVVSYLPAIPGWFATNDLMRKRLL